MPVPLVSLPSTTWHAIRDRGQATPGQGARLWLQEQGARLGSKSLPAWPRASKSKSKVHGLAPRAYPPCLLEPNPQPSTLNQISKQVARVNVKLEEVLANMRTVRQFAMEEDEAASYAALLSATSGALPTHLGCTRACPHTSSVPSAHKERACSSTSSCWSHTSTVASRGAPVAAVQRACQGWRRLTRQRGRGRASARVCAC